MLKKTDYLPDSNVGKLCPACQQKINAGDEVALCGSCGSPHHKKCWQDVGGCSSYFCKRAVNISPEDRAPDIVISEEEILAAYPLEHKPINTAIPVRGEASFQTGQQPAKYSKRAISALILAILGIPLVGCLTGIVAILLGSSAISAISSHRNLKGRGIAIAGLGLGVADIIIWMVLLVTLFLSHKSPVDIIYRGQAMPPISFPSEELLENTPQPIRKAFKANVFVLGQMGNKVWSGSGVIIKIQGNTVYILTNQHIANPDYPARNSTREPELKVFFYTGDTTFAKVEWIAQKDVDIALLRCHFSGVDRLPNTRIEPQPNVHISEEVFAVGNPRNLSWTYTKGNVSSIREKKLGATNIEIIQTQTPINKGNSGGGLYDMDGRLIGIITWTTDKSISEGLNFAISTRTIYKIVEKAKRGLL